MCIRDRAGCLHQARSFAGEPAGHSDRAPGQQLCVHRPGIGGRGVAGIQPGARPRSDEHLSRLPAAGFGGLLSGGDFARLVTAFSEAFARDIFVVCLPQADGHRIRARAIGRSLDFGGRARIVDADADGSGDGARRIVGVRTRRAVGEEDGQTEADRLDRLANACTGQFWERASKTFGMGYF